MHGRLKVERVLLKRGFASGGAPATKTAYGWLGELSIELLKHSTLSRKGCKDRGGIGH